eukprot:ctg_4504.g450
MGEASRMVAQAGGGGGQSKSGTASATAAAAADRGCASRQAPTTPPITSAVSLAAVAFIIQTPSAGRVVAPRSRAPPAQTAVTGAARRRTPPATAAVAKHRANRRASCRR